MWGLGLSGGDQQIPAGCGAVRLEATQSFLPLYPALESGIITAISRKSFLFPYSRHTLYHLRTREPQSLVSDPSFYSRVSLLCPCCGDKCRGSSRNACRRVPSEVRSYFVYEDLWPSLQVQHVILRRTDSTTLDPS